MSSTDPAMRDLVDILGYIASKDEFIWNITRKDKALSEVLKVLANKLQDGLNDFNYEFSLNGEQLVLERMSKLDFKTIFDVGCNVGNWSLTASQYFPQARIHTFELSQNTFQVAQQRLQGENYILNNFGLSNQTSVIQYKDYGASSVFNTLLNDVEFHDNYIPYTTCEGQITTGDYYCATQQIEFIDFLKIDVEGAEHLVMLGFENMLQAKKIRCLQFEYGYANGDAHFLMKDFFKLLNEKSYIVGKICSDGVEFMNFHYPLNHFLSGPNYLAIPAYDTELINLLKRPK